MHDVAHIGFHKTASTWLQRMVFPGLVKHRLVSRAKDRPVHVAILDHLLRAPEEEYVPGVFRSLIEADPLPVLVSDERLSGDVWTGDGAERSATRLVAGLRDPGAVIVVRSQATMLTSLYAQYLNVVGRHRSSAGWSAEAVARASTGRAWSTTGW